MRISRWGNSLPVRLPVHVVKALDFQDEDSVNIRVTADGADELRKTGGVEDDLIRLQKYRGRMPADFKFDRSEAHERG
ncbi:MAG: AbrB family transcriptional regulator [Alphaproteobacteria bacterium]|jgi:antitoxin MazE|nr:AbrB family transcriptional regulator [Alphaproteobacteria bacterium]